MSARVATRRQGAPIARGPVSPVRSIDSPTPSGIGSNSPAVPVVRPTDESVVQPLQFREQRPGKPPVHFADLTEAERVAAVVELGGKAFRAKQLATHYFVHHTTDPQQMTDLPKAERERYVAQLFPPLLTAKRVMTADGGRTVKTLWHLFDGARIESVLMRYPRRTTLCVSTQSGCGMACPFCATGQIGLTRNLTAAEIVEQVRLAMLSAERGELPGGPTRLNNVVFMGMGEGLANYRPLLSAIRTMIAEPPNGLGLSARNLTVSTVGLVPGIRKLAAEGLPLTLAVSLHAPDDDLRSELVPINNRWGVAELLDTAHDYFRRTGRRVSIEYALIKNMNDQGWRADLLAKELDKRGRGWVHLNPIPLNPTPGSIWTASDPDVEQEFVERLRRAGIPTTIRDTRGSDIDGACGQLAAEEEQD